MPRRPSRTLVVLALPLAMGWLAQCEAAVARAQRWIERQAVERRSAVPRAPLFWSFREDFQNGREWSTADVLRMLREHPGTYLYLGGVSPTLPVGSPVLASLGARVDRWQEAIARARGTGITPDAGFLCGDWRPDAVFKHIDGSDGESSCFSLIDAQQCADSPCRDHVPNPCSRWEGDMQRDWGPAGRFDPDWLLRTPGTTWDRVVRDHYDGQDFCTGSGHEWESGGAHRRVICAANRPDARVVLYGSVDPARRRLRGVSGVGLDLRIPAAREWNARRLVSTLKRLGFDPGEPGCVLMAYKPGFWSHYDGPDAGRDCRAPEPRSWSGYATPDNAHTCPMPRPLVPNPYGPGEFETAMNEQMRAVFRLLDAPAPPSLQRDPAARETYARIRFVLTERPSTRNELWYIWEHDVRTSPRLVGEMDNRPSPVAPPRPAR